MALITQRALCNPERHELSALVHHLTQNWAGGQGCGREKRKGASRLPSGFLLLGEKSAFEFFPPACSTIGVGPCLSLFIEFFKGGAEAP